MPKTRTVKVLSIQQPYTDLIFYGDKFCENRTWQTRHRGELFIHASKLDRREIDYWLERGVDPMKDSPGKCLTGHIIGSVTLVDCLSIEVIEEIGEAAVDGKPAEELPPAHRAAYEAIRSWEESVWNYVVGDFCWILAAPKPLKKPIPTLGKLNVWEFEMFSSKP